MRQIQTGISVFLAIWACGCSVVDGPSVSAFGNPLPIGSSVGLVEPSERLSPSAQIASESLTRALTKAGFKVRAEPEFEIEIGFAQRDAAVGILVHEQGTNRPESGTWRSRPIESSGILKNCKEESTRLMGVVTRRATGDVVFRGSSENRACRTDLRRVIDNLAFSLVAKMRKRI